MSLHSDIEERHQDILMDINPGDLTVENFDLPSFPLLNDGDLGNTGRRGDNEEDILERLVAQDQNPHFTNNLGSSSEGEDNAESTDSDAEERFLHFPDWESYEDGDSFGMEGLKKGFEKEAAALGALPFIIVNFNILNHGLLANKLSAYDRDICKAFSYKLQTHTTDSAFNLLPRAFETVRPLPNLHGVRMRAAFLSGFKPEHYDCCPNSCCAYTGPHRDLQACPYCKEPRLYESGNAQKRFTYIPIIPRLKAFLANPKAAMEMAYRSSHKHDPTTTTDIFDGSHYRSLCSSKVEVDGEKLDHSYFSDPHDVALGLSTDGFAPFKRRKNTAWPLILFNFNLPPDIRFHINHILALGVIPGPKKPHDIDSFLWPVITELLKLLRGIPSYDVLHTAFFLLRAYLIICSGDIPAVSMLMHMKGHNGVSPCRMCEILGLRVPDTRATTHYVPLNRSSHPAVHADNTAIVKYNPRDLPLRTHGALIEQARRVQSATTNVELDRLAKRYGIKGVPMLSYLTSLSFPVSFPYDFMHLIWENLVKNLILFWTGEFKGLDEGWGEYVVADAIWEAVGAATHASGTTIPSAYGARVPNIMTDRSYVSAEMWSFWTLYLGPVLLRGRFQDAKYYRHFIWLVRLLTICLQFNISTAEIEEIDNGFVKWVQDYEEYILPYGFVCYTYFIISDCTINILLIVSPPAQLPSMPFFILLTASGQWDLSGVIGPSRWRGIVANYSQLSEVGATLTDPWTDS